MSHTDNKPCIACEPGVSRRTTEKVIELAQLCLRFGRVNRVTTSCWEIPGFKLCVDLIDDMPEPTE